MKTNKYLSIHSHTLTLNYGGSVVQNVHFNSISLSKFVLTLCITLLIACGSNPKSNPKEKTLEESYNELIYQVKIFRFNDQKQQVLEVVLEFLREHPSHYPARLLYARNLVDQRNLVEAERQFKIASKAKPNEKAVLFPLAMITMQNKNYLEAKTYLNKLNRQDSQVVYYLGKIAENYQEYELANSYYQEIKIGPYYLSAQLRLTVILAKTKSIESALSYLNNIKTINDKEKREVLLFKGNLLRDFKYYQRAFDYYTQFLNQNKHDTELLYYRSLAAERLGKINLVIKDLSYVIEQDPNNASALNALGYVLADHANKLPEALLFIERARQLEPTDAAITDSLGWIHFRMGNFQMAEKFLGEAMEQTDDPEVSAHYGEILWTLGKKKKAMQTWVSAKEKFGGNKILLETMARLSKL